jgi:quinol monooxygenase YgiN
VSVTLLTKRQAQPGQAEAVVALVRRVIETHLPHVVRHEPIRLFQARRDPTILLTVSTWASREAYRDSSRGQDVSAIDALSVGPPERRFCQRIKLYESVYEPVVAVSSILVDCPPAVRDALADYLTRDSKEFIVAQPGCVLRVVYVDEDDPCTFFVLSGWSSLEAWQQFLGAPVQTAREAIRARGGRVEEFVEGRTRAEVDPASLPV